MNPKNSEKHVNPSDGVERTDQGGNGPLVNTISGMPATPVQETPLDRSFVAGAPATVTSTNTGAVAALLNHEESEHFRTLWNEIQGKFVDEPRSAVQEADALVSDVIEKITQMLANEHSSLEEQWKDGKDISTEDLRKALQYYRSFFNRLVV